MQEKDRNENTKKPRLVINPPVFFISAILTIFLVGFAASAPDAAGKVFGAIQGWIAESAGWFYILAVAGFLVFTIALGLSSFGRIKLGPDHSQPDYSYGSWFAMLFSAGMGIGLMFFGVAEPIMHYVSPPVGEGSTVEAAREAMRITFFHWGIHAWAIYAVVALSLAFFAFRYNLPLTIRSALYPLIGERIYGPIGHTVDIFAVLGTIFGVATSLGFGVIQINSGLEYLFGVPVSPMVQVVLIAIITAIATLSVGLGLGLGHSPDLGAQHHPGGLFTWFRFNCRSHCFSPPNLRSKYGQLPFRNPQHDFQSLRLRAHWLDWRMDTFLLGLVDRMVSLCGHVHRPRVTRPNDSGICGWRSLRASGFHLFMDDFLRGYGFAHGDDGGHHRPVRGRSGRYFGRPFPIFRAPPVFQHYLFRSHLAGHHIFCYFFGFRFTGCRYANLRRQGRISALAAHILGYSGRSCGLRIAGGGRAQCPANGDHCQ